MRISRHRTSVPDEVSAEELGLLEWLSRPSDKALFLTDEEQGTCDALLGQLEARLGRAACLRLFHEWMMDPGWRRDLFNYPLPFNPLVVEVLELLARHRWPESLELCEQLAVLPEVGAKGGRRDVLETLLATLRSSGGAL